MNVTTEKQNGKIPFKFTPHFTEKFAKSMQLYQMALDKLNDVVHSATNCDYGYCSNKYSVRLITPNDISTFTSNLIKAFRIGMLQYNIDDIQKFSVESAYRFIAEHEDTPFDDSNVLGAFSGTYINPRDFVLTDLLSIAHNEVFPTSLKSNYEIGVQKMNIQEDLRKVNDLHFSGVMKNIVNALPGLIDRSDSIWQSYRPLQSEIFVNAIENFIMFAILLNTTTVVGMTNYVDPCTSYNTKELGDGDNKVHQESVNTTKNKPVFIVLSEGKTPLLSEAIRVKTKSNFSHASISFDPSLKKMWSYGRPSLNPDGTINNVKFGFKTEDIDERLFRGKHINIGVYAIYLPSKAVAEMEKYIEGYNGVKTKFDWGAMLSQLFSKDKTPSEDKYRRICSTFVDTVLKQTGVNITGKNSPNPGDFQTALDDADTTKVVNVFYGDSNNYSPSNAKKKLKAFTSDKASVTYESFVTECCLLKTDDTIFRSKIPFGVNFRELVLGDMTPDFADVKNALYYIIKHPKSPIAQLLTKYVTVNNICMPDASLVTNMIFKHHAEPIERGSWYNQRTGQRTYDDMYEMYDFHTDVDWLDKIVYGDPAYDGNYRRDNMGNQTVHPILNTLDTIYHVYGDKHLVTNEEVANHIIGVGNVMLGIISAYSRNDIADYQMAKDVLTVLGEIITRCILKLYHNNTRVVDNSDSMMDTMAPGYMYVESFVMEADDNNAGKPTTATSTPTVTVNRNANNSTAKNTFRNIKMMLGNLISKFIRWVHDNLQKVSSKFAEKHRLEISWVTNNQDLNNQIAQSLDGQNFSITVTNFPAYDIKLDRLTNVSNFGDKVNQELNSGKDVDSEKLFKELMPDGLKDVIKFQKGEGESDDLKVQNFVLYGDPNHQPSNEATKVTGKQFEDLCGNITDTTKALNEFAKIAKELDSAATALKKHLDSMKDEDTNNNKQESYVDDSNGSTFYAEQDGENNNNNNNSGSSNNNNSNNNNGTPPPINDNSTKVNNAISNSNASKSNVKAVYDVINRFSQIFATKVTNTIINKFYKDSYNVYRDIVQAYKQEGTKPNNEQPATAEPASQNNAQQNPSGGENNNGNS